MANRRQKLINADVDGALSDAPIDGSLYARQDGGWVVVGSGTAVTSFNTRTGAITPLQSDYDSFFLTPTEADALFLTPAEGDAAYYTRTLLDGGQLDNRYFTETEVNNTFLSIVNAGNLYYTRVLLDGGALDPRYYTKTEITSLIAVYLQDVRDDTNPVLGGNLDADGNSITGIGTLRTDFALVVTEPTLVRQLQIDVNGTNLDINTVNADNLTFTSTIGVIGAYQFFDAAEFQLRDGMDFIMYDTTGLESVTNVLTTGADYTTTFTNAVNWQVNGLSGNFRLADGAGLQVNDPTDAISAVWEMSGTGEFNLTSTSAVSYALREWTNMTLWDGAELVLEEGGLLRQVNSLRTRQSDFGYIGTTSEYSFAWTGGAVVSFEGMSQIDMSTGIRFDPSSSQPWITLDSISSGDIWTSQGAGISVGESGKKGEAAIHMTYRGDGRGFVGMGTVDDTAGTGGRPSGSHFDFTYNTFDIRAVGRLFVGNSAGNVNAVSYIDRPTLRGSINVEGQAAGSYAGYSISNRVMYMDNGSVGGLYDEVNDHWRFRADTSASGINLYFGTAVSLGTQSATATDNITGGFVRHFDSVNYPIGIAPLPHINISDTTTVTDTHQLKALRWTGGVAGLDVILVNDPTIRIGSWGMIVNESGTDKDIRGGAGVTLYWYDGTGGTTGDRSLNDGGACTWWKLSDTTYRVWGIGVS